MKFVESRKENQERSRSFVASWLAKEIEKKRITEQERKDVLGRISYHDSIAYGLGDVDFAVEAANEDFVLKARIFDDLAATTPAHAILASNTSSISITKIAGIIPQRAHQVIGMHFMNPVPVM